MEQKSRRAHAENVRITHEADRAAHERAALHHSAMHTRYEVPATRVITRSANHYSPARHEAFLPELPGEATNNVQEPSQVNKPD